MPNDVNANSSAFSRRKFINLGALSLPALFGFSNNSKPTSINNNLHHASEKIPTLTGDLDPKLMGITLMHEHLLFFNGAAPDDPGFVPLPENKRQDSIDFVAGRLNDAARVGVKTLVDVGPYRPIDVYVDIAKKTTVKIIVSTGFYRESKLPPWFSTIMTEDEMIAYMTKEVQEGIGDTKFRAGIIKVAQQNSPTSDWETRVFRSAAAVQKKTGVRIVTHTGNAVEQFDLLMKSGADPKKVYFSHTDVNRKGKVGDLIKLLKAGSYIEVDTFAQPFYTSEAMLVAFIRDVCDAGYSKQLFISMDSNWHWVNGEKKFEGSEAPHFDKTAYDRSFAYLITDVVPMLLKNGFSLDEIKTFLVDNPQQYFS